MPLKTKAKSYRRNGQNLPEISQSAEQTLNNDYGTPDALHKMGSSSRLLQNQRHTAGIVRSIFDSCYLRPDENPVVIQDDDPVKTHNLSKANERFFKQMEEK